MRTRSFGQRIWLRVCAAVQSFRRLHRVSFGIPAPRLHDEANHLVGVIELKGLQFVCVNSAWFCRR